MFRQSFSSFTKNAKWIRLVEENSHFVFIFELDHRLQLRDGARVLANSFGDDDFPRYFCFSRILGFTSGLRVEQLFQMIHVVVAIPVDFRARSFGALLNREIGLFVDEKQVASFCISWNGRSDCREAIATEVNRLKVNYEKSGRTCLQKQAIGQVYFYYWALNLDRFLWTGFFDRTSCLGKTLFRWKTCHRRTYFLSFNPALKEAYPDKPV